MEKNLLSNLFSMTKQYRARLLLGFIMLIISNGLLILNPLIFRQAIIALNPSEEHSTEFMPKILKTIMGQSTHSLFSWVILLIGIALTSSFFKYQMRLVFMSVSRDVEYQVRLKLFERMQMQSQAFYDRHGIGELLSRLTNDISAYRDVLGPGFIYPLFFLTMIIPAMIALFSISVPLATVSLIPLICIPLLNSLLRRHIYEASHIVQHFLGVMSNMAQEYFSGIRIVKSYVIESLVYKRFCNLCLSFRNESIKLSCLQSLLFPALTLITKIVTIILVIIAGFLILISAEQLSSADFVSFMWIQSYLFFPVLMLAWILPIYERGRAAYDRLVEIFDEPIEVQPGRQPHLNIPANADIHLCDLTFVYPNSSHPVLSHLNTTFKSGEFVGITGPVGSGKSTLFRLLNREYEIPHGMIYFGEHDIHEYSLDAFSHAMVTVEQVPFLFSKSIADNVRFGKEEASMEELETVLRHADLHEAILEFPEQYETMVGERGVKLSGGQKQRVAVARAFLVNRHILLLDDIFSALDTATEKRIFAAMKKNFVNKTVLLISHRASILEQLERVIYMADGKIIEDGSPYELKQKKGHFAALVKLQAEGGSYAL